MRAFSAFLVALLVAAALPAATTRDGRWIEDLDYFARELPKRHANAYANVPRSEFEAAVARLRSDIPRLKDHEVVVRFMALAAMVGDAHTSIGASFSGLYPLNLVWLEDGLYANRVGRGNEAILGGRLVRMNGRGIEEVIGLLATIISHENDQWPRVFVPNLIVRPEVLQSLGITSSTGDAVTFEFESQSGERIEAAIAPGLQSEASEWPDRGVVPTPRYLRKQSVNYWYEFDEPAHTLYFAYNKCAEIPGRSFLQVMQELAAFEATHEIARFVIDLRNNTGGNSAIFAPMLSGLQSRPDINTPSRLFVLIGERTFSSGMLNAIELQNQTNATFIGTPTGGKPNSFGEVKTFTLPNSQLLVAYSTKYFTFAREGDPPSVMPDLYRPVTAAHYAAGRDPAFEATQPLKRRSVAK
jgi:hypothetical protein